LRRVGDELSQPRLRCGALVERVFDLRHHRVERDAQLPRLRAGGDLGDAMRKISTGYRGRGLGHLLDRAQAETHHEELSRFARITRIRPVTRISTCSIRDIDVDTSWSDRAITTGVGPLAGSPVFANLASTRH